jgi:hypothetical protein
MEKFSVRLKTRLDQLMKDGLTAGEWYSAAFKRAAEIIVDCVEQMELEDVKEEEDHFEFIRQQLAI